jgi:hypothetical protein
MRQKAKPPTLQVSIQILGNRVDALVDTGATHSFLRRDFVPDYTHWICRDDTEWITASGAAVRDLGQVRAAVKIDERVIIHDFHVAKEGWLNKCILGFDFLNRNQVTIDASNFKMKFPSEKRSEQVCAMSPVPETDRLYPLDLKTLEEVQEAIVDQVRRADLDIDDKNRLNMLLTENIDVFRFQLKKYGGSLLGEHKIVLTDPNPVYSKPRRQSSALQSIIDGEVDKMIEWGVAEPSDSDYGASILIIWKKDGRPRVCIDYRKLNAVTQKDRYPMPDTNEALDRLAESKYRSKMDLCTGFWQIPLEKESRRYAAFTTRRGLYQPTAMPLGLTNSPSTFQRVMNQVIGDAKGRWAWVHIDDIIVYSKSFREHLEHLAEMFVRIRKYNLYLKISKCEFACEEMEYLGHMIGPTSIKPMESKTSAIRNCRKPSDRREVKSFLGLAGYYRRFIPKFAEKARPLTRLTSPKLQFEWTKDCQEAFDLLKAELSGAGVLRYPVPDSPFHIVCDASGIALGGVLEQKQNDD